MKKITEKQMLILLIIFLLLSWIGIFTTNFLLILFIIPALVFLVKWLKARKQRLSQKGSKEISSSVAKNNVEQINKANSVNINSESSKSSSTVKISEPRKFPESFSVDGDFYELKYKYDEVSIVGSQYIDGAEQRIKNLNINSLVIIYREEDNPKDPKAVAVCEMENGKKYKLGYLPKSSRLYDMFNDFADRGEHVSIKIDENHPGYFKLGFYKIVSNRKDRTKNLNSKTFSLTGTKNNEIQSTISYADVGEELSYDYDYEKDKYFVEASAGTIGYIPKNKEELVENSDNIEMYIDEINENDEGIYSVKVELFYD